MRIRNNIPALNSGNRLGQTGKALSKSMEKLSSGLRIGRAGDDAAGLAISEKMRAQIRGLERAGQNIQDGISLTQTAEGGLSNIHEQLQRARELTIQAANDTLAPADRAEIQKEIDQIKQGIDTIANNTEFNTIKLLNGTNPHSHIPNSSVPSSYNYENALFLNVNTRGDLDLRTIEGYPGTTYDDNQVLIYGSGGNSRPQLLIDNVAYEIKSYVTQGTTEQNGTFETIYTINNVEVKQLARIVNDKYEFKYEIKNNDSDDKEIGFYFHMDVMVGTDDAAPFIVNNTDILLEEAYSGGNLPDTFSVYNSNPAYQDMKVEGIIKGANIIEDPSEFRIGSYSDVGNALGWTDTDQSVGDSGYGLLWSQRTVSGTGSFAVNTFYGLGVPPTIPDPTQTTLQQGPYDIDLQVGANSGNKFKVQLSDVRTATLGIDDIGVEPYSRAMVALEKIDESIKAVSSERSKYGAYQNGLEHVYNNVTNSSLNLTAAESRIRDVDIAKEMMEQTKNSILSQATQAILAQANQQPQGVLQLLR